MKAEQLPDITTVVSDGHSLRRAAATAISSLAIGRLGTQYAKLAGFFQAAAAATTAPVQPTAGGGGAAPSVRPDSTATAGDKTYSVALSGWQPWTSFKIILGNSSNVAYNVSVCGSASATAYPGGTFNIATPTAGWSAAQVVPVPIAIDARIPGMALSAAIEKASITRAAGEADNGTAPLAFARVYTSGGATYCSLLPAFNAQWDASNEGMSCLIGDVYFGNSVATPDNQVTSARAAGGALSILGIQYQYAQPTVTVGGPGDSVFAGSTGYGGQWGFPYLFKAAARLRPTRRIAYYGGGISGSTMPQIRARGKQITDNNLVDVMFLHSYTVNSAYNTAADWQAQWADVVATAEYHLRARPTNRVVIVTPLPYNSLTVAQRALHRAHLDTVRNSGYDVLDVDITCNATRGFLNPLWTSDGIHTTPTYNEYVATLAQAKLGAYLPE